MDLINYKIFDNENIFCINDLVEFDLIITALQDKIIQLKENNNDKVIYITLDLGKRNISSNELLMMFDVILNEEFILINKINCVAENKANIEILEGMVRGGQYLTFENSILILGDVNPNATIIAKDNIYVVGKCSGKLISTSKNGMISASSFFNSIVQIYDSKLEIINSKESCSVTYNNKDIIVNKNCQKKGENYVKSNCSYVR